MEKIIEHIGIETLKRYGGQNCCLDDYLFVTDRLENILAGGKTIKMEVLLMIYCMEGEVKLELNNQTCHLKADDLLVSLPNMLIGEVLASPSYKVKIICLSNRFIQRLTQTENILGNHSTIYIEILSSTLMKKTKSCSINIWD